MRLGISLPVTGMPLRETVEFAREAAGWGYEEVWASEVAGPDFVSLLGAVATGTDLATGVAVAPVQTRSPWLLAATASSLSHLSNGRFTLGLGTSSELIVERWSGVPFERPLARLRETVEVVRAMLAGERVDHDGEFLITKGYPLFAPPPAPVPLYIGALNPGSLRQAGEIGDGLCLNQFGPEHLPRILAEVEAGRKSAGKDTAEPFDVVARIFCWVTDEPEAARNQARAVFAPYAATKVYNRFFRWLGFEEEMAVLAEAFGRRDRAAAAAALTDEFMAACYVIGGAEEVADRVAEYVAAGVTVPVIAAMGPGRAEATRTLRAIADGLGQT